MHIESLKKIEMHELLCCLRLLTSRSLPDRMRSQIQAKTRSLVKDSVVTDTAAWSGYGLRPLQVVERPDSPFMDSLSSAVMANLDYEISMQSEEGCWLPNWFWNDDYPEAWLQAKSDWTGVLTLEKLITLKRFGRVEGYD